MTTGFPSTSPGGTLLFNADACMLGALSLPAVVDFPLICPAWWVSPLHTFLQMPTVTVNNRSDSGQAGRTAYPPVIDQRADGIGFKILGTVDKDGTAYAPDVDGLAANLYDLLINLLLPRDPVGTLTYTTADSAITRSGPVQWTTCPVSLDTEKLIKIETNLGFILPQGMLW